MKVVVLGAGVVGVCTAYYLNKAGHQVTVIDRQPGAGLETSFANGGQISVGHVMPWAAPGAPWLMLKWLGREDAPLLYHFRADLSQWLWSLRFLRNCTTARFQLNTAKNIKMALYSRSLLPDIRRDTDFDYDHRDQGILQIFRNQKELDAAAVMAERLVGLGSRNRILSASACFQLEPALAETGGKLVGGIHSPDDESGDAHLFTLKLAEICRNRGVEFRYGETIKSLTANDRRIVGAITDKGEIDADAFVVSMGSYSPLLLRTVGIKAPIYPTKGYSVTIPTTGDDGAPTISLTDEDNKLVYSRLGDRLRVAGTAEFAGYDTNLDMRRATSILDITRRQFPHAGDFEAAQFWTGLRPMTPDGVPIVGATKYQNLYLNTGHGTLGWTMCAGSGKAIADLIGGNKSTVDLTDFGLDRF